MEGGRERGEVHNSNDKLCLWGSCDWIGEKVREGVIWLLHTGSYGHHFYLPHFAYFLSGPQLVKLLDQQDDSVLCRSYHSGVYSSIHFFWPVGFKSVFWCFNAGVCMGRTPFFVFINGDQLSFVHQRRVIIYPISCISAPASVKLMKTSYEK